MKMNLWSRSEGRMKVELCFEMRIGTLHLKISIKDKDTPMAGQATLIFYPCHMKRKKEKSINVHMQAQKKDPCQLYNKDVQCGIGKHKVPVM